MSALAGASTRPLTTTDWVMRVDSTRATSTAVPRIAKYAASASATPPTATIARTLRVRRNAGMVASATLRGRSGGNEEVNHFGALRCLIGLKVAPTHCAPMGTRTIGDRG